MRKLVSVLCFVLAVDLAAAESTKEIARDIRESVVLLRVSGKLGVEIGTGTGFAVGDGLIATNHHVIEGGAAVAAVSEDGGSFPFSEVVADDEFNDLALLRIPQGLELAPLPLELGAVEPGDRVVVVGNPLGLSGTVSEGIVAALRLDGLGPDAPDLREQPLIQLTAPISPGSSGSPVVNEAGRVIGVAVAVYHGGQNLNFAIPASALGELLQAAANGSAARRLGVAVGSPAVARNLAISLLFFVVVGTAYFMMGRSEGRKAGATSQSQSSFKRREPPKRPWR